MHRGPQLEDSGHVQSLDEALGDDSDSRAARPLHPGREGYLKNFGEYGLDELEILRFEFGVGELVTTVGI